MAVAPKYQGQGVAGKLIRKGLEEVDKAGQDIYLEATAAGLALYKRAGFETLEQVSLFDGEVVCTAMLRKASSV